MYGLGWIDDVSIQKDAWIHFVSEFTAKLLCFGKMPYEYPVEAIPRPIMEARDRPELVLPRPRPCGKLQLLLVTQARSLMDSMAYTVMSSKELSIRITHIQNQLLRLRKSEVTVPCTGNKDWTAHVYPECNTLADQMSLRDEDDAFCNVFIPHSKDTYAATGFFDASFHIEDGRAWSGWGIYILSFGMSHWKIAQVGSRRQDGTSSVAMAEAKAALDLVNAIQIRCGKTPRRQDEREL
jgi:hypothetical protein